jgi:hypothetical protein
MEGWHHRIGMAKPLGFGSATVRITGLALLDIKTRYGLLGQDGWVDRLAQKDSWIQSFKNALAERYGQSFETLPNVADLRALLAETPPLPVHYPRVDVRASVEGKNFEWFMGNKRAGRDAGPRLTLPTTGDEEQGLPLMDKYGRIRNR